MRKISQRELARIVCPLSREYYPDGFPGGAGVRLSVNYLERPLTFLRLIQHALNFRAALNKLFESRFLG